MFKPTLACEADLEKLSFPLYVSPKLDGIRCSVVNGLPLTRTLKAVPNVLVHKDLAHPECSGLDGELIVGPAEASDVYRVTVSGIMGRDKKPDYTYHVFDLHNERGSWAHRFQLLQKKLEQLNKTNIKLLQHTRVDRIEDLLQLEEHTVLQGFEGLILRSPDAPYKYGRSTAREGYLMKLKRFKDSEAAVIEVIEEMHNANEAQTNELGRTQRSSHKANKIGKGRMGALRVRDLHSGVEFELGTGFTDIDREWWWRASAPHPIVKYKFFPIGVKDKPRHPVFLGLRHLADI